MLRQFTIENFKSYEKATLQLAPFTLLIGTNASGKSNALEALALMSWAARGARLPELRGAVKDGALRLRGHATELSHDTTDPLIVLHAVVDGPKELGALHLDLGLQIEADGLRVVRERLDAPASDSTLPLYEVVDSADPYAPGLTVRYNNFARGGRKPTIVCADSHPVFTQLLTPARFARGHTKASQLIPRAVESVSAALADVLFLDPKPAQMRESAYRNPSSLLGDGSNVSGVLFRLCHEGFGMLAADAGKAAILAFIRNLPEQEIADIRFLKSAREEVMVALVESFPNRALAEPMPAALLSDGTLRVLAIAAALLSVDSGSLVVIEEIDNGVHPSRAAGLVQSIQTVAQERELRVLVTTHNPALLDVVPDSAVSDVTVCYRDPKSGASQLVRLGDRDDFVSLAMRGPLGAVMTDGVLERTLKRVKSETRFEGFQAWLEGLGDES